METQQMSSLVDLLDKKLIQCAVGQQLGLLALMKNTQQLHNQVIFRQRRQAHAPVRRNTWSSIQAELTEVSPVMLHCSRVVSSTTVSPSRGLSDAALLQFTANPSNKTITYNNFVPKQRKSCSDETGKSIQELTILSCYSTARPYTHINDWVGAIQKKITTHKHFGQGEIQRTKTNFHLFIYFKHFLYDYVTLWDRPLYLVTTAELTQSGSSKSTLKLLLLLTDRRTALGASGGSEEADRRWDGEKGERSAGSVSSRADTAR